MIFGPLDFCVGKTNVFTVYLLAGSTLLSMSVMRGFFLCVCVCVCVKALLYVYLSLNIMGLNVILSGTTK